jgi:hypothetical protein
MATGKRASKPAPVRASGRPKSALAKMSPVEQAAILQTLLQQHPALKPEAEAIAIEIVSASSSEDVAYDVFEAVTSLTMDDLDGRAGEHSWGYVEPTEAAWELLQESIQIFVDDMKRRLELGLKPAAEAVCIGIVVGLYKANDDSSDLLLGWAPDFAAETACQAIAELIEAYPAKGRSAVSARLVATLGDLVPDWQEMISRAAAAALRTK